MSQPRRQEAQWTNGIEKQLWVALRLTMSDPCKKPLSCNLLSGEVRGGPGRTEDSEESEDLKVKDLVNRFNRQLRTL